MMVLGLKVRAVRGWSALVRAWLARSDGLPVGGSHFGTTNGLVQKMHAATKRLGGQALRPRCQALVPDDIYGSLVQASPRPCASEPAVWRRYRPAYADDDRR